MRASFGEPEEPNCTIHVDCLSGHGIDIEPGHGCRMDDRGNRPGIDADERRILRQIAEPHLRPPVSDSEPGGQIRYLAGALLPGRGADPEADRHSAGEESRSDSRPQIAVGARYENAPVHAASQTSAGHRSGSPPKRVRKAKSHRSSPKATQPENAGAPSRPIPNVSPKKLLCELIDPIAISPEKTISVL